MGYFEFRAMQGRAKIAQVRGTDLRRAEAEIFRYALQYRHEGDVTVQKQVRQADPNPDGKWYWKRHALFAQFDAVQQ